MISDPGEEAKMKCPSCGTDWDDGNSKGSTFCPKEPSLCVDMLVVYDNVAEY